MKCKNFFKHAEKEGIDSEIEFIDDNIFILYQCIVILHKKFNYYDKCFLLILAIASQGTKGLKDELKEENLSLYNQFQNIYDDWIKRNNDDKKLFYSHILSDIT